MNKIVSAISKHINMFELFTEVYIFGSVITNSKFPNDIDLLLVYDKYSNKIQYEKDNIYLSLEKLFNLHIDLTILSEEELKQTGFLEKVGFVYERLK